MSVAQQQAVVSLNLTFPAGVNRLDGVLNASGSVSVGDRAQVLDNASQPGLVSCSGSSTCSVGVEASVGSIISVGPVRLRSRAVAGDAISATSITKDSDATIRGIEASHATLTPATSFSFTVDFPDSVAAPISVEPNTSDTLDPGHYSTVTVKRAATLRLSSGDYTFRTLDIQDEGIVYVVDGAKLAVRDELLLKGNAWSSSGPPPVLPGIPPVWNIVYAGTLDVGINSAFQGSLIAPRAKLVLAAKDHTGWFYARDIDVQAGATVRARPGTQICIPSHGCTTIEQPPAGVRLPLPDPLPTTAPAPVGAVPWSFGVTPTGMAAYTVPIEVPLGPGGIAPAISLSYASVQSVGIAGTGWSLSGLSAIARCPKSSGTDGFAAGISDTQKDRLCLDGQPLIAHEGRYRTELESFRRITPIGSPQAPSGFLVEQRDGKKLEYGGSGATDSHDGVIRAWMLRRVMDRSGNAMTMRYRRGCADGACSDAPLIPERIDFGEHVNPDVAGDRSVRFSYEDRPDARQAWQRGALRTLTARLTRIATYVGDSEQRSHELSYGPDPTISRLDSLRQCALGSCMPATSFNYDSSEGFNIARSADEVSPPEWFGNGVTSGARGRTLVLDVDGDGFDDLLYPDIDGEHPDGNPSFSYFVARSAGAVADFVGPRFEAPFNTQLSADGVGLGSVPVNCLSSGNVFDYNGDGRDDIVDECPHGSFGFRVQISNGNGFDAVPLPLPNDGYPEDRVYTADLTGDGHVDLIHCAYEEGSTAADPRFRYDLYQSLGPGQGFDAPRDLIRYGPGCEYAPLFIDVDGDGVVNVVQRSRDPYHDYRLGLPTDWNVEYRALFIDPDGHAWRDIGLEVPEIPVDIDGTPLGLNAEEDYRLEEYLSDGHLVLSQYANGWQLKSLDVNGDGLVDLLNYRGDLPTEQRMTLFVNTGDGFRREGTMLPSDAPYISRFAFYRSVPVDHDGDGRHDLLVPTGLSRNGTNLVWYVLRASGTSAAFEVQPATGPVSEFTLFDGSAPILADVDGDGGADLVMMDARAPHGLQVAYNLSSRANLMLTARDGLGKGVHIQYSPESAEQIGFRTYGQTGCSAATRQTVQCVRRVGPVVSSYSETIRDLPPDAPGGGTRVNMRHTFEYAGARRGFHGRGWLGFELRKRVTYDGDARVQVDVWHYDNSTYFEEVPGSVVGRVYPFSGLETLHIQTFPRLRERQVARLSADWQLELSDAGLPFAQLATSRTTVSESRPVPLQGRSVLSELNESFQTDSYGNRTRHQWTVDAGEDLAETRTIVRTFNPTAAQRASWLISLVRRVEATSETAESGVTRISMFDYDDAGRLRQTTREPDDAYYRLVTTVVARHSRTGHVQEVRETAAQGQQRTRRVVYDARGLYPVSHFDAEGFESRVLHDPATGKLRLAADPNSIVTRWGYDGFGREVTAETPSATTTTTYANLGFLDRERIGVVRHTTGGAHVETFLDGFSRPVRRITKGLRGTDVIERMTYDSFGRLRQHDRPHVSGDASQGSLLYQYDDLGRLTYEERGSGGKYRFEYLPFSDLPSVALDARARREAAEVVRLTDPAQRESWEVMGVRGAPAATIDAAGTLTQFFYGPFNDPIGTRDGKGNTTIIQPDRYGRTAMRRDPDSGDHRFTYFAFGELRTHTDASGDTQTLSYDALGRRTLVVDGDGTLNRWTYDTGVNAAHRVARTERVGESSVEFGYEPLSHTRNRGLLSSVTQTVAGESLSSRVEYDEFGRSSRTRYPASAGSELVVGHDYDDRGNLVSVFDDDTGEPFWELQEADQGYRIGSERFGNGVVTTTRYTDGLGLVLSIESARGGEPLQRLEHRYTTNGSLQVRLDGLDSSRNEYYSYDPLDRLTRVSRAIPSPLDPIDFAPGTTRSEIDYDELGNITAKTGIGEYSYAGPRPHAVTGAGDNHYDYDANGRQEYRAGPDVLGGVQELTYNAFGLPSSARVGQGSGQTLVEFDYDVTGARVRELSPTHMRVQLATLFQRVTSNDGATEHRHRIWGPHREVAEVVVREEGGEVSRSTVYLHANALGTPEVLTDEGGEVIHRQATDAFGKGEEPVGGGSGVLTSFTGHQHDLELGVVDMRGRLYDASVGRFLTPDPIIQAPFYSQGLNAYSYVFNSPTNFIDPLGLQAQPAGSGGCSAVWGSGLDGSGRPYTVTAEIDGCSPAPQSAPESAPTKAAPATGTEAAIAGAAGLGVGLGLGVGASYATGAFASLACGPGAPLCAGAVTIGITLSLAGAAIYSLWNGGAEQIADSASRLASGEGTVDDYFLGGSLVGGLASGPLAPRFNASGANPGLRLRQLFTGSAAVRGPASGARVISPPGPGQLLLGGADNPMGAMVLEGHGSTAAGSFTVPQGTYLQLPNSLFVAEEAAQAAAMRGTYPAGQSFFIGPGGSAPNLILHPPTPGMFVRPSSTIVKRPTLLRDILEPNMGVCVWGACR
ncbi:RHS repeat-associated core domain-containing protein [Sorangium sp. So ce327]|uniref:RHS repeat-associated core domain-containing protein n=1 Tax=Sorangium sp. So ce327 TaxID=3133301 RepID=UPI003F615ACB